MSMNQPVTAGQVAKLFGRSPTSQGQGRMVYPRGASRSDMDIVIHTDDALAPIVKTCSVEVLIPGMGIINSQLTRFLCALVGDIIGNYGVECGRDGLPCFVRDPSNGLFHRAQLVQRTEDVLVNCAIHPCGTATEGQKVLWYRREYGLYYRLEKEDEVIAIVGRDHMERMREASLSVFKIVASRAIEKGFVIARTGMITFGLNGLKIMLAGDLMTFGTACYSSLSANNDPEGVSFEIVPAWKYLKKHTGSDLVPDHVIMKVLERSVQLFTAISGKAPEGI